MFVADVSLKFNEGLANCKTAIQKLRKLANSHILSRDKLMINTVTGQTLSRSYGRCIAEFLDEESLVHLGLLDLSTCVGLRYG